MKHRIAIWAGAGALVVVCWTLYVSATFPTPLAAEGVVWTLACLSCPIALAHHYALSFYLVLLANAATYALVGVIVETIRQTTKPVRFQTGDPLPNGRVRAEKAHEAYAVQLGRRSAKDC